MDRRYGGAEFLAEVGFLRSIKIGFIIRLKMSFSEIYLITQFSMQSLQILGVIVFREWIYKGTVFH